MSSLQSDDTNEQPGEPNKSEELAARVPVEGRSSTRHAPVS